ARGEADHVTLEVHNFGAPIPAELLPRLFERLTRGSNASGTRGSVGLGLFIANQIARAHGGSVRAESTRDAGTTFFVTLPRRTVAPGADASGSEGTTH
ncbi:MAG: sensor histidine kinase, partial [Myxococcales bacterium]